MLGEKSKTGVRKINFNGEENLLGEERAWVKTLSV